MSRVNSPEVPERAILAWERAHGLRITVHDLQGSLWPFLKPDRFQHTQPVCQAIKLLERDRACVLWEIKRLRRDVGSFPGGRVQVCHAGLVEWAVPVFSEEKLEWVLFAGVRSVAPGLRAAYDDFSPLPGEFLRDAARQPPPVGNDEAQDLLEHLCQLAARLRLWRMEGETAGAKAASDAQRPDNVAARRTSILRFVTMRHTQTVKLSDMAQQLNLSPSRASHAVRESCGQNFQELVTQARLRTAMGLLRHSGLSIREVAHSSGFESPRQFYRLFRQQTGLSPLQYRKTAQT